MYVCMYVLKSSDIPVFTVIFTVKIHYLHFPPLLLLLPNSITFKFHTPLEIILYLHIPILANSKTTDLQPNSSTCKFIQPCVTFSSWFHAWSHVHGVTKETVSRHCVSNHSCICSICNHIIIHCSHGVYFAYYTRPYSFYGFILENVKVLPKLFLDSFLATKYHVMKNMDNAIMFI